MKAITWKILLAAAVVTLGTDRARAGLFTGDPLQDGWNQLGDSLDLGTYVRGAGGYDFTLYSQSFALDSGSNLHNGTSWLAGDLILGIGATVSETSNLSRSMRIVAKYGTSTSTYSASTLPSPSGNGNGSSSAGHGGDGGILLGTPSPNSHGQYVIAANANQVLGFDAPGSVMERQTGMATTTLDPATIDAGRLIFQTDNVYQGGPTLSSLEVFLNVSRLERLGYLVNPGEGDKFVLTLQRSNSSTEFTDALGLTAAAVPEPSSLAMVGLGAAGVVAGFIRRRAVR